MQGPAQQPLGSLNPEYFNGDGSSSHEPFSAESTKHQSKVIHAAVGSSSTSDLSKQQNQVIKDFFLDDKFVIKEEKHKIHKKSSCKWKSLGATA